MDTASAFQTTDFVVDWENRRARCPEGHETTGWGEYKDKTSGRSYIRAGFNVVDCRSCSSKSRCTRAASRRLNLHARPEHEALTATRARHESEAGPPPYAQPQCIQGSLSQCLPAIRVHLRRYPALGNV